MNTKRVGLPSAVLFTAPGCPHCPGMKLALNTLLKARDINDLTVLDASVETEHAQSLGIKSVPWLQLGPFQFDGTLSLGELRLWAERARSTDGLKIYFYEMLKSGKRSKVEQLIRQQPAHASILGDLLLDSEASMAVRIGIGAVLEEFQGSDLLASLVPKLVQILQQQEPRNRADAAHYLSLIANPAALDALRNCLQDSDAEVREIAQEALT